MKLSTLIKMDINAETEIKQKHSLTPFPVFLISLAFRGRYFHSHFQEFSHERLLHSGLS
ncbi:host-nuclease inhibitor protein gam [Escherichia coli B107]|nr:host-nuclease inhibitor protein gam [Escherichia coli B107]